jgi:fructokinase
MNPKVVCFGEMLIDFVALERDVPVGHASRFEKAAGGAPANVAVGLAKLGVPVAFMTQVGNDPFGHFLSETLHENGVDTSAVIFTDDARTALAFVSIEASGERSFAFYRKPSADMLMTVDDLDRRLLENAAIFHFGSITLIDEPIHSTTLAAIQIAKDYGALISYDPNLRSVLWPSLEAAHAGMLSGLHRANIVKMNDEELAFLTRHNDLQQTATIVSAARSLWHDDLALMVITQGNQGCIALNQQSHWQVDGCSINVEDTIGAGDGFMAGLLAGLIMRQTTQITDHIERDIIPILQQANAIGALTASKRGGIPALPNTETVKRFLVEHQHSPELLP